MRYFYDTEFLEDGKTIELISIGIVAEDSREYYAVNRAAPWKRIAKNDWLVTNVCTSLPRIHGDQRLHVGRSNPLALNFDHPAMKTRGDIANEVRDFLLAAGKPELWADYAAYDHVVLCQLWGSMIYLPEGLPMFTNDIQQEAKRLGVTDLPEQAVGQHNALADARHCVERWAYLASSRSRERD